VKEKEVKLNPGDGGSYYYAYYCKDNERSIKKIYKRFTSYC